MPNMSLTKVPMPEQAPNIRNQNFEEVTTGLYARNGNGGGTALPQLQA